MYETIPTQDKPNHAGYFVVSLDVVVLAVS